MNKDRPPRILVADDDAVGLQFLVAALRELGIEAMGVDNGKAVLDACGRASFDLLLLDRRMPDIGGAPLLRELRRRGCATAAVATSAELDGAARDELAEAGYGEAVTKPIGIDRLANLIARHLGTWHPQSRIAGANPDPTPPSAVTSSTVLEDEPALASVGGDHQMLLALRGLFANELETALPRIAAMSTRELGDWLHRLRASCRYCGAARLGDAAEKLELQLKTSGNRDESDFLTFLDACALTVEALSKAR